MTNTQADIQAATPADTQADNANKQAYDVFNGDADGICALHQLRLANPRDAILVTGAKRDIALLERVPLGQASEVNVFDISLDTNVLALKRLLDDGCQVNYFDHHAAQQAFTHPRLKFFWDESPEACTSVLVDLHLQGRFRPWAVTAAFGDNLEPVGRRLAADLGMPESQAQALQLLGTVLNYNAYGESVADLHIAPDILYRAVQPFVDPLDFIVNAREYKILHEGYQGDAERMAGLQALRSESCGAERTVGTPYFRGVCESFGGRRRWALFCCANRTKQRLLRRERALRRAHDTSCTSVLRDIRDWRWP